MWKTLSLGQGVAGAKLPLFVSVFNQRKFAPVNFLPCWLHISDSLHHVLVLFTSHHCEICWTKIIRVNLCRSVRDTRSWSGSSKELVSSLRCLFGWFSMSAEISAQIFSPMLAPCFYDVQVNTRKYKSCTSFCTSLHKFLGTKYLLMLERPPSTRPPVHSILF